MNLVNDKWIPVVKVDGTHGVVSLSELFKEGESIYDFTTAPHEKVALLRFCVCIVHAAINGPDDEQEWLDSKDIIKGKVSEYLSKWSHAFEMYGDGQRFLQFSSLAIPLKRKNKKKKDVDSEESSLVNVTKLDLSFPTNNGGIFLCKTSHHDLNLPLSLLAVQMFSNGGLIGDVVFSGETVHGKTKVEEAGDPEKPRFVGKKSHCINKSKIHFFLFGNNIINTMWLNLVKRETHGMEWGRPIWEKMPKDRFDMEAVMNATKTYLGNLVPMCRLVKIMEDGVVFGRGLPYNDEYADSFEARTEITTKDGGKKLIPLGFKAGESMWRNLHVILALGKFQITDREAPKQMTNLMSLDGESFNLWGGGNLYTDKYNHIDSCQSWIHIPRGMLESRSLDRYSKGVQYTNDMCKHLCKVIEKYREELGMEKSNVSFIAGIKMKYWHLLDGISSKLVEFSMDYTNTSQYKDSDNPWSATVRKAMSDIFEKSCPVESAKQIKAYCNAKGKLFKNNKQKKRK